jgi:hypothetical protein
MFLKLMDTIEKLIMLKSLTGTALWKLEISTGELSWPFETVLLERRKLLTYKRLLYMQGSFSVQLYY